MRARERCGLGLFGGTFDPIHLGHLILAGAVPGGVALDRVWLVVAGHRRTSRRADRGGPSLGDGPDRDRRPRGIGGLGYRGHPSGPHYSVETSEAVRRDHPDDELFFLIGADSLQGSSQVGGNPDGIARMATIVVVNRPGIEEVDGTNLPDFGPGSHPLRAVTIPPVGIASSDLRRRLGEGRNIRYMVSRGVEAYINEHPIISPRGDDGCQSPGPTRDPSSSLPSVTWTPSRRSAPPSRRRGVTGPPGESRSGSIGPLRSLRNAA